MPGPQPPASLAVAALFRAVREAGGFATVLARGSSHGSALVIVTRSAGAAPQAFEKVPNLAGRPEWRQAASGEDGVSEFVAAARRFDDDLWVVELDVAAPARFVPGLPAAV